MKWFNQNSGEIQKLPSSLPILIKNSKDDFENLKLNGHSIGVNDWVDDLKSDIYDLPPFPPLFSFDENGTYVMFKMST